MKEERKAHRFSRLELILGEDNISFFGDKTIMVVGLGGVGGYVVESLARCGIGRLILVDFDTVDITNINRQIIALTSTIGKYKADLLEERVKDINPSIEVVTIKKFIDKDNISELFDEHIDFVVDACDTIMTKKLIIKNCLDKNIDFITSMGTGNKLDPSKLEILDIRKTVNDPLARIMRKFVKDEHINKKVMTLCSTELPIKTHIITPGSNSFVPSSAGLLISSYIIRKFILDNKKES